MYPEKNLNYNSSICGCLTTSPAACGYLDMVWAGSLFKCASAGKQLIYLDILDSDSKFHYISNVRVCNFINTGIMVPVHTLYKVVGIGLKIIYFSSKLDYGSAEICIGQKLL